MSYKSNVVMLHEGPSASPDLRRVAEHIVMPGESGRVAVEMRPKLEGVGLVLLQDEIGGQLRPDIGTVIAVANDVDLLLGDEVVVRPYDGVWFEGGLGGYQTVAQIRIYGSARDNFDNTVVKQDWQSSILAVIEEGELKPLEGTVLVDRHYKDEEGGLALTKRKWGDTGRVLDAAHDGAHLIGSNAVFVEHLKDDFVTIEYGKWEGLWLIPLRCIEATYE